MSNLVEILLVDDSPEDVELTIRSLRRSKIVNDIFVAEDGAEALDFLFCRGQHSNRTFSDLPKLILLDLKLPKIDGLEVLKAIRADPRTKAIPVVVLTSSKEQRDLIQSYDLGVNAFVQKPVDFEQFGEAIRQIGMFWMLVNRAPPYGAFPSSKAQGA
ncbi:MAG: response regulator [Candidatus Sulfotelmatobacter sp.]|jgi:two-component system, response regulator